MRGIAFLGVDVLDVAENDRMEDFLQCRLAASRPDLMAGDAYFRNKLRACLAVKTPDFAAARGKRGRPGR